MKFTLYPFILAALVFGFGATAFSASPNCGGENGWPAAMAYASLKNKGIIESDSVELKKTTTQLLAVELVGKDKDYHENLYRQIYLITFTRKDATKVSVITSSEATQTECSMGGVEVYLINEKIN